MKKAAETIIRLNGVSCNGCSITRAEVDTMVENYQAEQESNAVNIEAEGQTTIYFSATDEKN